MISQSISRWFRRISQWFRQISHVLLSCEMCEIDLPHVGLVVDSGGGLFSASTVHTYCTVHGPRDGSSRGEGGATVPRALRDIGPQVADVVDAFGTNLVIQAFQHKPSKDFRRPNRAYRFEH